MSHFAVAVISKQPWDVEALLAPYQENNMGDCPQEYLGFFDIGQEYREKYENNTIQRVKLLSGLLLDPHSDVFKLPDPNGFGYTYKVPESPLYQLVDVPIKDVYPTFERYMEEYVEAEPDEQGRYGYWINPNAKWDYWRVGGRYRGLIKAAKGQLDELSWEHTYGGEEYVDPVNRCDIAQIQDIDLSMDEDVYKYSLRFWEVNVEGQPLAEGENADDFRCFWKPEYYLERYPSKEMYAKTQASFGTWALLTPDGKWHEQGQMGWWALNDATKDSIETYHSLFEKTLREADPECYVTIVDCHI